MTLSRPTMSAIRFGYGIRPGEDVPDGPEALLAQVKAGASEPLRFPAEGIEERRAAITDNNQRYAEAKDKEDKARQRRNRRPLRLQNRRTNALDMHARVNQSVFSPNGFYERLVFFWFNHFSVSVRKQRSMSLLIPLYEAEALRPNIGGKFSALLRAAILHPAMLVYLDQAKSAGPNSPASRNRKGLNENLGRELLELHTLGVNGGYKQQDVRDAALILTGLKVERFSFQPIFQRRFAEPGPLNFMGKSYGGKRRNIEDIEALLDDLAAMPPTRAHICRKLAVHFISDDPPQPVVDAMTKAWETSGGDLMQVYAAMLAHPAAWENAGEKARQPFDYVVAGLRALNIPESALAVPDKNDEDSADKTASPGEEKKPMVMSPGSMQSNAMSDMEDADEEPAKSAERAKMPDDRQQRLLNKLSVRAISDLGQPIWEPSSPAGFAEGFSVWIASGQLTGRIEWARLAADKADRRSDPAGLLKASLRDAARDDTIRVVEQAPNRISGIMLALASPEFNRR